MVQDKTNIDNKNEWRIPNDITMMSGTTFTPANFVFPPGTLGDGLIPYEYYVYKIAGVTQVRNNSGIVAYSGIDTGLVINHMLSGANNNIAIGFQPNYYSGATDVQNNGRRGVTWFGNGASFGMKIRLNGSGNCIRVSRNVFDSFNFSGTGAGLVFDSTFHPSVQNCTFEYCHEGISFESNNQWSELWHLSNVHFNNCKKGLIFKQLSGVGTGSYVNGFMDHASFNVESSIVNFPYTHMELQNTATLDSSKIINTRWWFYNTSGIGIHAQSGSTMARTLWFKPLFENFGVAGTNDAIRVDPTAGTFFFYGRPVFQGATFARNLVNSGSVWISGPDATWRSHTSITIPATANTYSSSTTIISNTNDEFSGIPNILVIIGGTLAASETVTVEITTNAVHVGGAFALFTVTKTYQYTGTYPLELDDYIALTPNEYRYLMKDVTVRVKSSATSTTATVSAGGFTGGTAFQGAPKFSGVTLFSAMTNTKISTPSDQADTEVGLIYFKQIDANNNGYFYKAQRGGVIVEIPI